MKKLSLKTMNEKGRLVLHRFPFTLVFILGLAYYFLLKINNHNALIQERIWAFLSLGIALSILVTLFSEEFKKQIIKIGLNLLSVILLSFYVYSLPEKLLTYHYYQLVIIGLSFVLSSFVISFLKRNNDIPFWEFSKTVILQLFISFVFAQVLMSGLSLAVLSLKELFGVNIKPEVYGNLAVFCYLIFASIYFLANVPNETEKRKSEYTFNKFIKILGLYILLPILAIYSLILYVYLAQIIVKWELPNGWVSTLISTLGIVGFLCMLILYPLRLENENKIVNLFSKYFPLILLPLLILMSVGIIRRFDDYGLTINRCYVLILNAWLYFISIYLFISKANHLKWMVISFATIAFLSSVGPWSVFAVTKQSLVANLKTSFTNAHLLKNGKVFIPQNKSFVIDTLLQVRIIEDIRYLSNNYGNESFQLYFSKPIKDKSTPELFKEMNLDENIKTNKFLKYFSANLGYKSLKLNVEPYKYFVRIIISQDKDSVYSDNELTIKYDKKSQTLKVKSPLKSYSISLKEKIQMIKNLDATNQNREFSSDELTIKTNDYKLVICVLNANQEHSNNIKINNLEAYLFY
ncbi:MAG: DUF4153 domain-containing protein [Paludibacter sp.]